ncbi:MAG: hypothetical protein ACLQUZ_18630 [Rhizomicrobium sp.]
MKTILKAALISAGIGLAATAAAPPAIAQIGISVNFGDVAIGYRDGYYDSHHRWHRWAHPDDYKNYSHAHPEHFHDMNHRDDHHH